MAATVRPSVRRWCGLMCVIRIANVIEPPEARRGMPSTLARLAVSRQPASQLIATEKRKVSRIFCRAAGSRTATGTATRAPRLRSRPHTRTLSRGRRSGRRYELGTFGRRATACATRRGARGSALTDNKISTKAIGRKATLSLVSVNIESSATGQANVFAHQARAARSVALEARLPLRAARRLLGLVGQCPTASAV
jgi:hypothetical protein